MVIIIKLKKKKKKRQSFVCVKDTTCFYVYSKFRLRWETVFGNIGFGSLVQIFALFKPWLPRSLCTPKGHVAVLATSFFDKEKEVGRDQR